MRKIRLIVGGYCAWLLSLFFPSIGTSSVPDICKGLFQKQQYIRAAHCFRDLAQSIEKTKQLQPEERARVGSYLRNASLCLRKAADGEKNVGKQSHLREQALSYIHWLLEKKYYENDGEKGTARVIGEQIEEAIGYIQITVTTGNAKAQTTISGGYRFAKVQQEGANSTFKIRPGNYTLVVLYPSQKSKAQALSLIPKQPAVILAFQEEKIPLPTPTKPLPPPSLPIASYIFFGVGGAAILAGGIFIAIAAATLPPPQQVGKELEVVEIIDRPLFWTGLISIGVGTAAVIVGLVLLVRHPKSPEKIAVGPAPFSFQEHASSFVEHY